MQREILRFAVKATFLAGFLLLSSTFIQSQPPIAFQPVITAGLSGPIEVVTAPGDATGRLFIVEKSGIIRIHRANAVLATPFLNISSLVEDGGEQGLLSMAFHPQYAINGFFFVYYNNNSGAVTIARYQVSPGNPDVATPTANPVAPLLTIPKSFDNHNGGHLQFRVEGGTNWLYFATGDGGSGNDPDRNAQDQTSLLGKMIRMNVDLPTPVAQIWAWGLRNPFRWSFDRLNGDMWIGDVGQGLLEEVSRRTAGTAGANYGWPCFEGTNENAAGQSGSDCDTVETAHLAPIFEYPNPAGGSSSVVGGYVYRGTEFPTLYGYYLVTDFYLNTFWLVNPATGVATAPLPGLVNIASISETNDGSTLYAVSLTENAVYKIVVPFPTPLTLLSFSGKAFDSRNEIRWITTAERDIDKFIVEYSSNGRDYLAAGELPAGQSNGGAYLFNHNINIAGNLYYRLKIVETDGRSYFSPVISLGKANGKNIAVYPTVVRNGLVNVNSSETVELLELYNNDGKKVYSKNLNNQAGYFNFSLPQLSRGMYYLRISGKDLIQTTKLMIE